jgi:hypothetical protein
MKSFTKLKTSGVVFLFLFFALALTLFAFFRLSPVYEGNSTMGATSCLSSTGQEFLRCNLYCIDTVRNTPDNITKMRFTECIHSTPYQYKLPTTAPPTTTPFKTTPPTTRPFKTTPFPTLSCVGATDPKYCKCANEAGFNYKTTTYTQLNAQQQKTLDQCMRATDLLPINPLGSRMGGVQTTKDPYYLKKGPCSLFKANATEYAKCKDYCYSSFQPGTQEFGKCMF